MTNRDDSNFFSEENYNENFDDDDDGDEDNDGENNKNFINKNEVLYTMELDHLDNRLYKEINAAILKESVKIASNSFFWRWFTVNKKIRKILHIYYSLVDHVNFDKDDLE